MELGGRVDGSFFKSPKWCDLAKPAGSTPIPVPPSDWWKNNISLHTYFFMSPNLWWFTISLIVYIIFPYDFDAGKVWAFDWVFKRFVIHLVVMFLYVGFWHVTLYWLGWGKRKFQPGQTPGLERFVFHNIAYSILGVACLTGWEVMFINLWSTGKLPFIADSDILSSGPNFLRALAWVFLVPHWRDIHFYLCHRFIHIRAIYKYVHSLHHRNTDIEPFAGLCMHSIEHLFYMSCMGISLYVLTSPLALLWNAYHLLLAPAASHSGWEDNIQSDFYHYIHHATFECNYGAPGLPFDVYFNTFRNTYDVPNKGKLPSHIPKPQGFGLRDILPQSMSHFAYNVITFLIFLSVVDAVSNPTDFKAQYIPSVVTYGPLVSAFVLWYLSGDDFSALWPFHKEKASVFWFHIVFGFVICILPVYHVMASVLSKESTYCKMWSC